MRLPIRPLVVVLAALLPVALAASQGCKGDPEETAPAAVPAPPPTPTPLTTIAPEEPDAGADAATDAAEDADAKKPGYGGDPTGIRACCSALRQNAKSAPPEQQGAYMMAAGACDAVRNSPQGRAALSQVRAALRGANVPSSCR